MAADELADKLSVEICKRLGVLPPLLPYSDCTIVRVPAELRNVNEKAYEPVVLAIGPYHRGKNHLMAMEEHKLHYLKLLLERRGENNVTRYLNTMRTLEERARKCYTQPIGLETDQFVEMMLLDSCFITELLRKYRRPELRDVNDPIFNLSWMTKKLARDLLLVENQIPFFVLQEFSGMTLMPGEEKLFRPMIYSFFRILIPGHYCGQYSDNSVQEIKHLLGFIHDSWLPSPSGMRSPEIVTESCDWDLIRCATELKEAGIKFMEVKGDSLFDIRFDNGTLQIPRLIIEDDTESFLRNLIVYEQFSRDDNLNYVVDYMNFMDCLINSPKDVELLCQHGIIHNWLGDDEVVANMFNRLGDFVMVSDHNYYSEIFCNVNKHCGRRWNKWMAHLRHKYFNNPWALISFLAALSLLLLTSAQTLFTVLAYFQ
ncbi:hypothetical protein OWV82_006346 [Melia azedarach]|uniref:Uncharacterized protein n=1 Tax=Melia azedarach TaxID=155640 RepID=A0ACC1YGV4_MELAZ|nr:hypothetical protein OWV82_006346 [Melia azedarach]